MVEMALDMLSKKSTVQLDEERKAAMVSNLLVVLCGDRSTQPVIKSGVLRAAITRAQHVDSHGGLRHCRPDGDRRGLRRHPDDVYGSVDAFA